MHNLFFEGPAASLALAFVNVDFEGPADLVDIGLRFTVCDLRFAIYALWFMARPKWRRAVHGARLSGLRLLYYMHD